MKTKTGFILLGLMVLFFITCRKDKDDPEGGNKIEFGANSIDTISYFFTGIQTEVISLGGNEIIQHGHCWNTETNPTINENHTLLGKLSSEIDFLSTIDTLLPNTVYFVRPYIQTAYAVAYGEEEQIKTLKTGKPVVSTNPVSEITLTSVLCGGMVTRDSGLVVTARGVCWDTTTVFRIDSCLGFNIDSLGLGNFSSEVTGLHEGKTYHLAAYGTNEKGTSYGEVRTFSTIPVTPPVVVTTDITNITTTSAQSGGNVTSDGNGTVTIRGICWDTLSTPSFENNIGHTEDGSGLGEYTSNITNLHEGKTYYVVAYASNEKGSGYGEIKSFTATPIITPQVTTANVTSITTTSAQCGGNVTNNGNGLVTLRGVCWNDTGNPTLINSIGHTEDGSGLGTFTSMVTGLEDGVTYYVAAYATNENETGYGEVKNFTTTTFPTVSTTSVTNITATTATSGGNVTDDGGASIIARGVCWSTSQNPTISNSHTNNGSGIGGFTSNIAGLSPATTYYVRAYATNIAGTGYGNELSFTTTPITTPTVTTSSITNITNITAISGGNVIDDGGSIVTERGVCWSTEQNPTISNSYTTNGSGNGTFICIITGLSPNLTYYVRSFATNIVGTAYGNQLNFITQSAPIPCPGIPTVSYEGQTYTTVQIGSQCWFKENLNVGSVLYGNQNPSDNGVKEKYCYEDNLANCSIYGGLYQWNEMMQYTTQQGIQGICPAGWHIPSYEELQLLQDFLGGQNDAGGPMKESGTLHWYPPNTGATNVSGFTGLPGGDRESEDNYYFLGYTAYFWSSSENGTESAVSNMLNHNATFVHNAMIEKFRSLSVRCAKD